MSRRHSLRRGPAELDALLRSAASNRRVIGFAGGLPAAERFPRRALTAAFLHVIQQRDTPALQYTWPEGFAPLREQIARRLVSRGATVKADEVIVTNGAQQAITIAARLLLHRRAAVGVDTATYPSALTTFRALGLHPTTRSTVRVMYRMPAIANPGGGSIDEHTRQAVLGAARFVIEDDAYGDLRFQGPAPAPLLATARRRVLYVGTFSKTLGPGLRVGFLIVPRSLHGAALRHKADDDLQANSLSQAIVQEYLAGNDFDGFLQSLRRYYARRADRLMAAVRRHLPSWSFAPPEGGFGLWMTADGRIDEARFLDRAVRGGVSFDPGSPFQCAKDDGARPTALRLCYSAVPEAAIEEGVRRLARAWHEARRGRAFPVPESPCAAGKRSHIARSGEPQPLRGARGQGEIHERDHQRFHGAAPARVGHPAPVRLPR